ncbi:hypothetical protein HK104_008139, partial [Borealophlyctis nickersoniae]
MDRRLAPRLSLSISSFMMLGLLLLLAVIGELDLALGITKNAHRVMVNEMCSQIRDESVILAQPSYAQNATNTTQQQQSSPQEQQQQQQPIRVMLLRSVQTTGPTDPNREELILDPLIKA